MSRPRQILTDSQIRHATAIFDGYRKQKQLVNTSHAAKVVFGYHNGGTPVKLIAALADKLGYIRKGKTSYGNAQRLLHAIWPKKQLAQQSLYFSSIDAIPDWVTRCDKS